MSLSRYGVMVLVLLVSMTAAHAATNDPTQSKRDRGDELIVYDQSSGAAVTFNEMRESAMDIVGSGAGSDQEALQLVCSIIITSCFALTAPEGQHPADAIVDCLCESGCLTKKSYDSLECGR